VFLPGDHEVARRGARDLLEAEPDIAVVSEAGAASSALARIPALQPDVAVLDVRLPDGDGVSVCPEIRSRMPEVACLMLTSFGGDNGQPAGRLFLAEKTVKNHVSALFTKLGMYAALVFGDELRAARPGD